jgi:hypothetical protein
MKTVFVVLMIAHEPLEMKKDFGMDSIRNTV